MTVVEKQKVLDVLNSLEVIEQSGGEDAYILVANNEDNLKKLNDLGVQADVINKYGDDETFCIIALAFSEKYANDFENGKLVYKTNQYAVYDTSSHDLNFHDTLEEAEEDYKEAKSYILEDDVTGDEIVYLLQVKKVAKLVEDTEREEDPKEHGYDGWVKWEDYE